MKRKSPASQPHVRGGYRAAVDAAAIFSETDIDGTITYVNDQFCQVSGYSSSELLGANHRILNSNQHPPEFFREMWRTIASGQIWKGEVCNRAKNGQLYWVDSTIVPMLDDDGMIYRYVSIRFNITEEHNLLERLRHKVGRDELTGLPNRLVLAEHFEQIISAPYRGEHQLAICMLDLDDFKAVNDRYGHAVGDQLITEVARRLDDITRSGDVVARIGGDEFVLVLNGIGNTRDLYQSLERVLTVVGAPYLIERLPISITGSIGVTLYPSDDVSADTLLRHADQAMYQAKQKGGNRVQQFDVIHEQQAKASHQNLARVTQALADGELRVHYQPKVHLRTGKILGFEALLRWQHPEIGLIPPGDFLPLVEQSDLIVEIGNWVLDEALTQLEDWNAQDHDWSVAVNIAARHFQRDDFATTIRQKLQRHATLRPDRLDLEIIESVAIDNIHHANRNLDSCKAMGVRISLDDFGTGYSSLSYLKRLPAQTIKIDQSFVRGILGDHSDQAVVEAIIRLSLAFEREVVAEGVETWPQARMLMLMGCEVAQGFGVARPMPGPAVVEWARSFDIRRFSSQAPSKAVCA
ncbi:putative bifunctional diguanylate cyclase/phosphodiesterase [Stutzerimonas tarimensis]|uniref:Bifunctional diguanylate cyclase/phosphodiesterase n=1 Tax=Stutzerimonas tarimensis TaxID=1507735 RepID=A0ABV7T6J4_9GAMM